MKKRLVLIMLLICAALILASCADAELKVNVTEKGGTVAYKYYVDKELADEYFNAELPDGIKACQIDEIDGRLCYVYSESFTAHSFSALEKKLCNIKLYGEDGMNAFSSASASSTSLKLTTKAFVNEDLKDIALIQGADLLELASLSLTVTMPYEIEEYSEGTLSEDKKTLTLMLSSFDVEKNVEIKCAEPITEAPLTQSPNTLRIIGVLITLVVIVAIALLVVFLITRRNRKRAEAMPDTPIDKI